jgi:conjugal transfer mating pair stabilization protein TraG
MDIVNYDVRNAIANAERAAAKSSNPERTFSKTLSRQVLGAEGLRNKYLENADSGRGTWDWSAPITSTEQATILDNGRFTTDRDHSSEDGDPTYKTRKD